MHLGQVPQPRRKKRSPHLTHYDINGMYGKKVDMMIIRL